MLYVKRIFRAFLPGLTLTVEKLLTQSSSFSQQRGIFSEVEQRQADSSTKWGGSDDAGSCQPPTARTSQV